MQINLNNMLKHWKLYLVLIFVFQAVSSLLFYLLNMQDIQIGSLTLKSDSLALSMGGGVACIVFLLFLKYKE
ncbi:Uncharacterised protein [Neisseria animaloris]|uniref:Uncharacterized protein n=1 Tax=Neisseria animaloris TaxID=326522 RepID=A0A1X3CHR8_9NEIS|nr:hypothetical protein [Neisseria animaloris]OSI06951.1 hypothetical protein BWD08_09925 [Neisseria animaloris]VEH88068.1 Uncharacterised protein [Neisseria animaloris]VEJ21897.1 Uncharacterised protein [Neisseria animaloris]